MIKPIYGGPVWNRQFIGWECRLCGGTGKVEPGYFGTDRCPRCNGTGLIPKEDRRALEGN